MNIENLAEGSEDFTGNVWLFTSPEKSENILVDVGTGDVWNEINELDSVEKVIITHSHYDHVDNLRKVEEKFNPEVYSYEPGNLGSEALKLDEGDSVELLGRKFEIFHTPGHKDDSICLYCSGVLFTGDLIFPDGGFGRTDLDEGDRGKLIESIEKISGLEVEEFYPGHDQAVKDNAQSSIRSSLENARKGEPKY